MSSEYVRKLSQHAQSQPNGLAAVEVAGAHRGRSITWRQLRNAAAALATRWQVSGQQPRVMLSCGNRIEYLVAFAAVMLADGVVFSVPPALTPFERQSAAATTGITTFIGEGAPAGCEAISLDALAWHDAADDSADAVAQRVVAGHAGRGALLLQSSGTTSLPKIVERGLPALDAVGRNCAAAVGMTRDDALLVVIPLCHSYAIDHAVMAAMHAGCRLDLCAAFQPVDVLASLAASGGSVMPVVPFMLEMMLAHADGMPEGLPRLRKVYSAGGPLPRETAELFARRFGVAVGQIYGSTEFASVTYNDPDAVLEAGATFDPVCVGRPMDGVDIRILDPDEPSVHQPLPTGSEGHVAVAAPSMLTRYVGHDDEAATVDGYFLSGDLGRLDAQGRLTVTGRIKLLIDVGGQKVNPFEVEAVLKDHPDVAEAVVVPVVVTATVARVKAVIEWKSAGGDVEALRALARQRLSPHKVPRYFEVVDALPRSPAGKVLRQKVMA